MSSSSADVGTAGVVLVLPAGNRPEGIAVDPAGRIFVGNRVVGGGGGIANQILMLSAGGASQLFATLPGSPLGSGGLLGLVTDSDGNVYAGLASADPATQGVYRVGAGGGPIERLAGSEAITFANGLTFDGDGNLYASDSFAGRIWRYHGGLFEVWAEGTLLQPLPTDPFGSPLPGANGIEFRPPNTMFVANTERGLIARIPVGEDGSAGVPTLVTSPFALPTVDGIALDVHGDLLAVLPGFTLLGAAPLLGVNTETGAVTPIVTDPAEAAKFDTPLSVTFGGRSDGKHVYVTNGHLPSAPGSAGPGVIRVAVGVPGSPI